MADDSIGLSILSAAHHDAWGLHRTEQRGYCYYGVERIINATRLNRKEHASDDGSLVSSIKFFAEVVRRLGGYVVPDSSTHAIAGCVVWPRARPPLPTSMYGVRTTSYTPYMCAYVRTDYICELYEVEKKREKIALKVSLPLPPCLPPASPAPPPSLDATPALPLPANSLHLIPASQPALLFWLSASLSPVPVSRRSTVLSPHSAALIRLIRFHSRDPFRPFFFFSFSSRSHTVLVIQPPPPFLLEQGPCFHRLLNSHKTAAGRDFPTYQPKTSISRSLIALPCAPSRRRLCTSITTWFPTASVAEA